MKRSVLLSIRPKWCELIESGQKTIEVRKTKPKLPTPFKCYIYCTKTNSGFGNEGGKVIGEFTCDEIYTIVQMGNMNSRQYDYLAMDIHALIDDIFDLACLSKKHIDTYLDGQKGYAWHISDLVIYDKPRKLSEFYVPCKESLTGKTTAKCNRCQYHRDEREMSLANEQNCVCDGGKPITHPPQSWCYVHDMERE